MSEDRYTYPSEDEDPRDIDRELTDTERQARLAKQRHVTNPQQPERAQGTSADAPGVDPSDRDRAE
jgi:hypothetical protein